MRNVYSALTCVGLLVTWGVLSYATTLRSGECDWPPASLRIRVLNARGLPIEGATFFVYQANIPATEFQQAFCYSSNWSSNKDGVIDLLVKPLRYKATSFRLFWFYQFTQSSVNFEARIHAPGFEPARMPFSDLLNTAEFEGRRRVNKAEAEKGFGFDEFDVLHVTLILKR